MNEDFLFVKECADKLVMNLELVIVGKKQTLVQTVIGLLCQGHILIEDVPGVGKTVLARSLAKSLGCTFSRIQFTPDMLPSDITGVSIFNQMQHNFEFRQGPVFSQIVLADEINRATPKTQAALLEAMEERQVTVEGITHPLPIPFLVLATQNPIEYEGTFPLPEAQLDRFLMRIRLGYPSILDEIKILEQQQISHPLERISEVLSFQELSRIQKQVRKVFLADSIKRYIIDIVRATRDHKEIFLGASPRASLGLLRTGQALAAISGRDYVLPEDIKRNAAAVLAHRIVINPSARINNLTPEQIIEEILMETNTPIGINSKD